jgi:alkanesulfonate monooxygenase SsuD/methylene tetrahydromethanopterin reductase-like flavin-dependent oxidoreductase (luciferase family)
VDREPGKKEPSRAPDMKASLFCTTRYDGPASHTVWPAPTDTYTAEWADRSMKRNIEQFRLGDEVGFDWITVAEHHFAPFSMTPNPMVLAAALIPVIKRAKIAVLGPDIPILDPVRVAEELAMVDTLSGGRMIAGLMRGSVNEYVTYNINPSESRERFEEALQLIRMCWTEVQPFGWQGRYYEYRSICIWPRTMQSPHPPIYMSTASPEAGEFAAKHRLGAGFAFTTVQIASKAAEHYRNQCRVHGWEPEPEHVIYRLAMHVAKTDEEAIDAMTEAGGALPSLGLSFRNRAVEQAVAGSGYYGRDIETQRARLQSRGQIQERIERGQLLVGTPDTVLKQIKRIKEQLGAGILDLVVASQLGDRTLGAIELFGTKVLPRMHEL